jgi:Cys-tRNA(Pro) deacylase
MASLSPSAQKVQVALIEKGFTYQVVEFPQTTRSAAEAAAAIGCEVGQIAKSLVFQAKQSGKPVLVIASGSNRVDEKKLKSLLGENVRRPNADFVRQQTGFAIGGIPPIGHTTLLETFIDQDLLQYPEIWAAAGTPNAVFRLFPSDLAQMTNGRVSDISL